MIIKKLKDNPWPHYVVVDGQGTEWTLPQLMLSRSVIAL